MSIRRENLLAAQSGDKAEMERLLTENSALIWSVAHRFTGRGCELEDLYQLGCIGFVKAVQGFDTEFGTQFSTYAVPKIAGEIKRFLRDDGIIKVSRSLKENAARVFAAREKFERERGRAPYVSELCDLTGLTAEEIAQTASAPAEPCSLDEPMGDEGFSLHNLLPAAGDEEKMVEHLDLRAAIDRLEEQQRMVILLRYYRDMTQQKVAQALGLTQVQVSRLEKRACRELQKMLSIR